MSTWRIGCGVADLVRELGLTGEHRRFPGIVARQPPERAIRRTGTARLSPACATVSRDCRRAARRRRSCPSRCIRRVSRRHETRGGWPDEWPSGADCSRTTAPGRCRRATRTRRRLGSERRMKPTIVSMARLDATSPAEWPPMPSATTKSWRSSSLAKLSSLIFRTGPMSVDPYALSTLGSCNGDTAENTTSSMKL